MAIKLLIAASLAIIIGFYKFDPWDFNFERESFFEKGKSIVFNSFEQGWVLSKTFLWFFSLLLLFILRFYILLVRRDTSDIFFGIDKFVFLWIWLFWWLY